MLNNEYLRKFFTAPGEVDQAKSAFRDYLAASGPYQNVRWPEKGASVRDVVEFFETGQPSWLLGDLGLHFASLAGSQGMSERSWATLSRQVQPIRSGLLYPAKKRLLNIAANWKLLCPDLAPVPQEKKHRKHDFEVPVLAGRRAVPEESGGQPAQGGAPSSSSTASSSSSSSSSNVLEIAEDDDLGYAGCDDLVDAGDSANAPEEALAACAFRALGLDS